MSAALARRTDAEPLRRAQGNPYLRGLLRAFRRPLGLLCLAVLLGLIAAAVFAPLLAPNGPTAQLRGLELRAPSAAHPFGTDEFGRDLLSRTVYGLRVSFLAGVLSVLLGGSAGTVLGLVAGYREGWLGAVIMRLVDGLIAFPAILLGIAIVSALGPGIRNVTATIAVVNVPVFARLAYAGVLAEKRRDYVTAATTLGASGRRVLFGHMLINVLPPLTVQAALTMGFSVLVEASLSFVGLGIRPPSPSLGSIIEGSRRFMRQKLYYPLFPGAVLALLLLGLNALADTLNDGLSPRARH